MAYAWKQKRTGSFLFAPSALIGHVLKCKLRFKCPCLLCNSAGPDIETRTGHCWVISDVRQCQDWCKRQSSVNWASVCKFKKDLSKSVSTRVCLEYCTSYENAINRIVFFLNCIKRRICSNTNNDNGVSYGNNTVSKLQTVVKENAYSCLNMTVVLDLPVFDTLVDMLRVADEDVSSVALDETWKLQRV